MWKGSRLQPGDRRFDSFYRLHGNYKMNSKDIGNRTEAIILAELIKKGHTVLMPFGDNERYDLVVDIDGIFIRIQCKTSSRHRGTITFSVNSSYLNTKGKCVLNSYSDKVIDCFMSHSPDEDKIYLIDVVDVGSSCIKLRIDEPHPKYKGSGDCIRWAVDYEFKDFGKVLERLKRSAC